MTQVRTVLQSVAQLLPLWTTSLIGLQSKRCFPLHWRHNGHDSVSKYQPHDCLSKLRVTGLCAGNSTETGEFPAQTASNAENVSIWWRHYAEIMQMLQGREDDFVQILTGIRDGPLLDLEDNVALNLLLDVGKYMRQDNKTNMRYSETTKETETAKVGQICVAIWRQ